MYTKVLFSFACTILLVNSQLITTKRLKSSIKNCIKVPKNFPLAPMAPCNCPMDVSRIQKCPCGCPNPMECKGPIINSFGCSERPCKCGNCRTTGQCRCSDLPIIDSSFNFLPELPVNVPSINVPSINVPFSIIEVPSDYPVLCQGCQGPCQCRVMKMEPTCPLIEPNYSPVILESYLTPDMSIYRAPINVPKFLVEPSCGSCGCPEQSCNCRSNNPVYEIFAPVQECPAPQLSCGCSGQCGCAQNVKTRMTVIDLPTCAMEVPKCSCGLPSCGCPAPVVGCPKYLRQVTIQPPFL